ncbi:MAG: hypothetical protein H8E38_12400 [SAR324 cluster bacterium]|nr:hypothetical protein [SAR324 cluster bacterium]MBL7036186.1 hypothetical protein [SAR324 cluster bacterium]
MLQKNLKYFLLFGFLFLLSGCSATKLFYDYGDLVVSWKLDSYFDLNSEQEDWVEERVRLHLEWHRKTELPTYRLFLIDLQNSAKDGLSKQELDQLFFDFEEKRDRIFERLIPDSAVFLSTLSTEQINSLEREMAEENKELIKELENPELRLQKREKNFWAQMEDWFGKFSQSQRKEISVLHTKWLTETPDPLAERLQRRRISQPQFLALLRSSPDNAQLENWFRSWFLSWEGENNAAREKRLQRNKKRIMLVDQLLTAEQRLHAVRELDDWIDVLEQTIIDH